MMQRVFDVWINPPASVIPGSRSEARNPEMGRLLQAAKGQAKQTFAASHDSPNLWNPGSAARPRNDDLRRDRLRFSPGQLCYPHFRNMGSGFGFAAPG